MAMPAPCTIWLAAASPARLALPTSSGVSVPLAARRSASAGLRPACADASASRAIAGPPAIVSTQPTLPQWQRGPAGSTQMWPTSPAEPFAPR